jgi:hypothetical protein
MKKWFAPALVLAAFAARDAAVACECGYIQGLDALNVSRVVARGRLVEVRRTIVWRWRLPPEIRHDMYFPFLPADRLTFALSAVWKGEPNPELVLYQFGCCVCEAGPFELGHEYLLYATRHVMAPGLLMASFCYPNHPVSRAAADLAQLGPPIAMPLWTPERTVKIEMERIAGLGETALAKSLDVLNSGYDAIAPSRPYVSPTVWLLAWLVELAAPVVLVVACAAWRLHVRRSKLRRARSAGLEPPDRDSQGGTASADAPDSR